MANIVVARFGHRLSPPTRAARWASDAFDARASLPRVLLPYNRAQLHPSQRQVVTFVESQSAKRIRCSSRLGKAINAVDIARLFWARHVPAPLSLWVKTLTAESARENPKPTFSQNCIQLYVQSMF